MLELDILASLSSGRNTGGGAVPGVHGSPPPNCPRTKVSSMELLNRKRIVNIVGHIVIVVSISTGGSSQVDNTRSGNRLSTFCI